MIRDFDEKERANGNKMKENQVQLFFFALYVIYFILIESQFSSIFVA